MGSEKQKQRFEKIHEVYKQHFYDATALQFREQFIFDKLFENLDLNNKKIAELACGSGYNSLHLLEKFPQAEVAGYDISPKACEDYKKITGMKSFVCDLTKEYSSESGYYDAVLIIGGLHHCVQYMDQVMENIYRMLKPGGLLIVSEPSNQYFLEAVRKFWYRHDKIFDNENEAALNHEALLNKYSDKFNLINITYRGGPAFFLIYNSLIFRLPIGLKKYIAKPLFIAEKIYNKLPGKAPYPFFIAQWKKSS